MELHLGLRRQSKDGGLAMFILSGIAGICQTMLKCSAPNCWQFQARQLVVVVLFNSGKNKQQQQTKTHQPNSDENLNSVFFTCLSHLTVTFKDKELLWKYCILPCPNCM